MIKGAVSARAVALQDLLSDLKVLDKKTISLGVLNLEIDEQTKRTLEEEIEQKHKAQIKEFAEKGVQIPNNEGTIVKDKKENDEKEEQEQEPEPEDKSIDDGADDLII